MTQKLKFALGMAENIVQFSQSEVVLHSKDNKVLWEWLVNTIPGQEFML